MANAVGGSNHRSARQSYRLDLDATPARWPLTTDELLPYYARVEEAAAVEPSPAAPWTEMMRAAAAEPPLGDDRRPGRDGASRSAPASSARLSTTIGSRC